MSFLKKKNLQLSLNPKHQHLVRELMKILINLRLKHNTEKKMR